MKTKPYYIEVCQGGELCLSILTNRKDAKELILAEKVLLGLPIEEVTVKENPIGYAEVSLWEAEDGSVTYSDDNNPEMNCVVRMTT